MSAPLSAPRPVRRGLAIAGALTLGAALAACSGTAGSDDGGPAEVRVALPTSVTSFANADVAVAQELGYFEDAGLQVEVSNLRSGTSVTNGVVGGEFEVGGASIEPVINAVAGGAEISVFASYADRLEVELVVPEDVQSVEDLAGKDLGIQEIGAFREAMTRMVLEDAGMTQDDVSYVSVSADAYVSGLVQGQITSAVLHPEQSIQAAQEDPGLHPLVNLYEVEPDYFYGAYFADNAWIEEDPEAARGFAEAITRAHRAMYEERDRVVPIIAEATSMEESVIDEAWEVYMEDVQAFPQNVGLEEDRLRYTIERMSQMETLAPGAEVDLGTLVNREPIEAAVQELGEVQERE
ncbi:ABC transporter substrate-binding protein [Georgenia alba]|uniref:ABC transporter substrate-binding protein n=1 Tax=Georgenia alba TaxID=2233858 RepID=A0ABW2Q8E0_9MICO